MQTFLPYADFKLSAAALDRARLGKQRLECLQILKALRGDSKGWQNHPATLMWRGHERALLQYAIVCCQEWKRRGYRDSMLDKYFYNWFPSGWANNIPMPPWFGDGAFHSMHRAVLLDKDPEWYSHFGWSEKPATRIDGSYPYVWPKVIS